MFIKSCVCDNFFVRQPVAATTQGPLTVFHPVYIMSMLFIVFIWLVYVSYTQSMYKPDTCPIHSPCTGMLIASHVTRTVRVFWCSFVNILRFNFVLVSLSWYADDCQVISTTSWNLLLMSSLKTRPFDFFLPLLIFPFFSVVRVCVGWSVWVFKTNKTNQRNKMWIVDNRFLI